MEKKKNKIFALDIKQLAIDRNCNANDLKDWLKMKGHPNSLKKVINIPELQYYKVIKDVEQGILNEFKPSIEDKKRIANEDLKLLTKKVAQVSNQIANEKHRIALQQKIGENKTELIKRELDLIRKDIAIQGNTNNRTGFKNQSIEELEKRKKILKTQLDGVNGQQYNQPHNLAQLEGTKEIYLQQINELRKLFIGDSIKLDPLLLDAKEKQLFADRNKFLRTETINIQWDDVTFLDGAITIKYRGKPLKSHPVKYSRKSFNSIKQVYKFRNAPLLILEINGNEILQIKNIEVLTYYLQFLENVKTEFHDKISTNIIQKHNRYNKSFYKRNLPQLMLSRCFSFLCECSDNELPIIPIPESVINSKGAIIIHDSFLFPIVRKTKILWLWESIEESKATYLFQTTSTNFETKVQEIFDYLTGETVNKRETLIHSNKLKEYLGILTRVYHSDFSSWKNELHHII